MKQTVRCRGKKLTWPDAVFFEGWWGGGEGNDGYPRSTATGVGCCSVVCRQSQACLVVFGFRKATGRPPLFVAVDHFVGDERLIILSGSGTQRRDLDEGFGSLWKSLGAVVARFRCPLSNGIPSPRQNGDPVTSSW